MAGVWALVGQTTGKQVQAPAILFCDIPVAHASFDRLFVFNQSEKCANIGRALCLLQAQSRRGFSSLEDNMPDSQEWSLRLSGDGRWGGSLTEIKLLTYVGSHSTEAQAGTRRPRNLSYIIGTNHPDNQRHTRRRSSLPFQLIEQLIECHTREFHRIADNP